MNLDTTGITLDVIQKNPEIDLQRLINQLQFVGGDSETIAEGTPLTYRLGFLENCGRIISKNQKYTITESGEKYLTRQKKRNKKLYRIRILKNFIQFVLIPTTTVGAFIIAILK